MEQTLFNNDIQNMKNYIMFEIKAKQIELTPMLKAKNRAPIALSMGAPVDRIPQFAFDKVQSFQIAPSVALLFFFLCLVFKVQLRVGIPSKLNNVRWSEKADLRKSVGVVTYMSP